MDRLQQYLRETHDAGRLPIEADFEMFKADRPNHDRCICCGIIRAIAVRTDGRSRSPAQLWGQGRVADTHLVVVGDRRQP